MTKKLEFIQNDVSTKVVVQYIKITLSIYFSASKTEESAYYPFTNKLSND